MCTFLSVSQLYDRYFRIKNIGLMRNRVGARLKAEILMREEDCSNDILLTHHGHLCNKVMNPSSDLLTIYLREDSRYLIASPSAKTLPAAIPNPMAPSLLTTSLRTS